MDRPNPNWAENNWANYDKCKAVYWDDMLL